MICSRSKIKRIWSPRMDKRRAYEGQTLVELALVLPCFCLGIFMAVQLMTYCHNMVELQRMSMVALHRVTIENYKDAYKHYWFHSLYRSEERRDRKSTRL